MAEQHGKYCVYRDEALHKARRRIGTSYIGNHVVLLVTNVYRTVQDKGADAHTYSPAVLGIDAALHASHACCA